MKQKFKKNTVVRIADDLGDSMSHFSGSGKLAVVEYTYDEKYGGGDIKSYSLYIEDEGSSSWYYEHQLSYVSDEGEALITKWKQDMETKRTREIDWKSVYDDSPENLPSSTINYLWEGVMRYGSIWGKNGEGYVAYFNSDIVNEAYKYCKRKGFDKEDLPYIIQELRKEIAAQRRT